MALQYMSQRYTYTTELGEEIDRFFKTNFPIGQISQGAEIPYMDEDLGEELVREYGYQLFVEGIKFYNEY